RPLRAPRRRGMGRWRGRPDRPDRPVTNASGLAREGSPVTLGRMSNVNDSMNDVRPCPPRVIVLGAGFGGLTAARSLRGAPFPVTVAARPNHPFSQPLLSQVAPAALNPSDIASPIRRILRGQANAEVLMAEAEAVDTAGRRVMLADEVLDYDYLV